MDVWAYVKDVLDQLLAGSTDYESLRPDVWKAAHPEAIRTYREEERRDRASRAAQKLSLAQIAAAWRSEQEPWSVKPCLIQSVISRTKNGASRALP